MVKLVNFKGRWLLFVTVDGKMPDSFTKDIVIVQENIIGNFALFVLPINVSKSSSGRYSKEGDKNHVKEVIINLTV
ncbi:MAG: hypothetical protein ACK5BO_09480 [Bacteroidota bacterium]